VLDEHLLRLLRPVHGGGRVLRMQATPLSPREGFASSLACTQVTTEPFATTRVVAGPLGPLLELQTWNRCALGGLP